MNKVFLKNTMLSLEVEGLGYTKRAYSEYLHGSARDYSEPVDQDQFSHEFNDAELAQAFECPLHGHSEAIAKLNKIDFGAKTEVEEGAAVRFGGRWFVIAVATSAFDYDGTSFIGMSKDAPIFTAIEGKRAGELFEFDGKEMRIEAVV